MWVPLIMKDKQKETGGVKANIPDPLPKSTFLQRTEQITFDFLKRAWRDGAQSRNDSDVITRSLAIIVTRLVFLRQMSKLTI